MHKYVSWHYHVQKKDSEVNVFYVLQMVDHRFPIQLTSAYTMIILYPLVQCIRILRKPGTTIQIQNMKYAIWNSKYVFGIPNTVFGIPYTLFGIPNTYLEFQMPYSEFQIRIWNSKYPI